MQAKLLRVLEAGEVQRVGSVEPKRVDVRVIAATNRHLERDIRDGKFRSDLFYRLNVVELLVPALRERSADVPYLTAAFLRRYAESFAKPISGLTPSAERLLIDAEWPGNVRQLRNVIERASLLCEGRLLTERDIARALGGRPGAGSDSVDEPATAAGPPPAKEQVTEALTAAGGNKALAAKRLGVSRRALYRLLEKYDLDEAPS